MLKASFLILIGLIFSGCIINYSAKSVQQNDIKKGEVAYEVLYDSKCKLNALGYLGLKKGEMFIAYDVENYYYKPIGEPKVKLLNNSIALNVHGNQIYALIYSNGEFISNYHIVAEWNGEFGPGAYAQKCKLIDGKPLFKQVGK